VYSLIILLVLALVLSLSISFFFFIIVLLYMVLNLAYSSFLKKKTILDILAIASGFILRVYGGAIVINTHINAWLLLCVVSFSLFLAIGKRRSEKTLLMSMGSKHREVLSHYPENLLTVYTSMFANTTWLTYALFTFQYPSFIRHGSVLTLMSELPKAFVNQKLLMLTIPLVIYGVMRYLQLIYDEDKGGSPEEVLLTDKPLFGTVIAWGILTVVILYGIG
jgi:4-hydroxybenzoate polyprenyltransferase